jgi:hypothetical protein
VKFEGYDLLSLLCNNIELFPMFITLGRAGAIDMYLYDFSYISDPDDDDDDNNHYRHNNNSPQISIIISITFKECRFELQFSQTKTASMFCFIFNNGFRII